MTERELGSEPRPTQVIALLQGLCQLKSHAIAFVLDCDRDTADEISKGLEAGELIDTLQTIKMLGDKRLDSAIAKISDLLK